MSEPVKFVLQPRHELLIKALKKAKPASLLMLRGLICKWRDDKMQKEDWNWYNKALELFDKKEYGSSDFMFIFTDVRDYQAGEILSR